MNFNIIFSLTKPTKILNTLSKLSQGYKRPLQQNYSTSKKKKKTEHTKMEKSSWIRRININIKILILSKAVYRLNVIQIKILTTFFLDLEKMMPKFLQKHKRLES